MRNIIKQWQLHLKDLGFPMIVDGVFGPKTLRYSKEASGAPKATAPDIDTPNLKPTKRKINELIWHCSATPDGREVTVDTIRGWHEARGWKDIGYHFVVGLDGRVHTGRPIHLVGAHVSGHNSGTVGCCYVGGMTSDMLKAKDTRTPEQKIAMEVLTTELVKIYGIDKISGHNEYASKACPSFDVRTDALGNITGFKNGRKI